MKKIIKNITAIMTVLCCAVLCMCSIYSKLLPDRITVYGNNHTSFNHFITVSNNNQSKKELNVNSDLRENYLKKNITLLNIIPIKEINVYTKEKKFVVPCGQLFGIKLYTRGVCVIECCNINNNNNPGRESGLESGDIILSVNNKKVTCCSDLLDIVENSNGNSLSLLCERHGRQFNTVITPINSDGNYRLGLWIRDSCAGLGTMTFYDPQTNNFAALGHGICDVDTGEVMPLESAEITQVKISSITKGTSGMPGIINGYFSENNNGISGYAQINNESGLYGKLNNPVPLFKPVELAAAHDVRKGKAEIICTLDDGVPKYYSIEIIGVNYDENNKTKNLQIAATDNRLLEKTGGIVQGMSGSPILQNGKLVGAVTHVLITNSARGYGIFAQNMFEEIEKGNN